MAPPASLRGVDIHSMSHPIPFPSQNWKFVNDLFPESGADWPNVFEVTVTGIPATPALSQVPEKGKAPQKGPTKEQTGPRLFLWFCISCAKGAKDGSSEARKMGWPENVMLAFPVAVSFRQRYGTPLRKRQKK